jgi:hypothetical protein
MDLIYLAAPYSDPDDKVIEDRMAKICKVDSLLMQRGNLVFSPLLKHFVRPYGNLPGDWEYWQDFCKATLPKCQIVYVLSIDGWQKSTGVQAEIKLAELLKIPTFLIDEQGHIITKL